MGQAWCKERSTKTQDSKSPLDRVFVRCAHRIYPGLKEEGSVLGATQRVASSEIGYAGSPPRANLTRGQSIDSMDRPFHPSEWVDVNLEVPSTPRTNSVLTNLTADTSLYPTTTPTSSCSNLKDVTPVPPPRKKKNKSRPLPPKPDESFESNGFINFNEPVYSSVKKTHKSQYNYTSDEKSLDTESSFEKTNGSEEIISREFPNWCQIGDDEGYTRSRRRRSLQSSSPPNKDSRKRTRSHDSTESDRRPKNCSTASLPDFNELQRNRSECEKLPDLSIRKDDVTDTSRDENSFKNLSQDSSKLSSSEIRNEDSFSPPPKYSIFATNPLNFQENIKTSTPVKSSIVNESRLSKDKDGFIEELGDRSPKFIGAHSVDNANTLVSDNVAGGQSKGLRRLEDAGFESRSYLFSDGSKGPHMRSEVFYETEVQEKPKRHPEDVIEGCSDAGKTESRDQRKTLSRRLSNESEPFDSFEEKELLPEELRRTAHSIGKSVGLNVPPLERTISEESLPKEMLEEDCRSDLFDEKLTKDAENLMKKVAVAGDDFDVVKTPPPSPESRIEPDILESDHSTLLKVLKDESEEMSRRSMTPTLSELESALSGILEVKEDSPKKARELEEQKKLLEEEIIPMEKKDQTIDDFFCKLDEKMEKPSITGQENMPINVPNQVDGIKIIAVDLKNKRNGEARINPFNDLPRVDAMGKVSPISEEPPEKPGRLHRTSFEDTTINVPLVPTPPRRKHRTKSNILKEDIRALETRDSAIYANDRLI